MLALRAGLRLWRIPGLVASVLAVAFVCWWLPAPVDVPGRSGGVEWVVTPILPTLVALSGWSSMRSAHLAIERASPRSPALRRLGAIVVTIVLGGLALGVALGARVAFVPTRNLLLLTGVASAGAGWLPSSVGWVPVVAPGALCWLLGSALPGRPPAPWAVLLHGSGSTAASICSLALLLVGTLAFVLPDQPPSWVP